MPSGLPLDPAPGDLAFCQCKLLPVGLAMAFDSYKDSAPLSDTRRERFSETPIPERKGLTRADAPVDRLFPRPRWLHPHR